METLQCKRLPSYIRPTIMPTTIFGIYPIKQQSVNIPLKDIHFKADINDGSSVVEITQLYANEGKVAVECEYVFPIDYATMAVISLTITIDDKTIEAKIMEKEKADEKYVDAISSGHTAIKMDYDNKQPDIVRVTLGNFLPGKTATVVTKYVKLLDVEDNSWSFRIPLTYTPRYMEDPTVESSTSQPVLMKGKKLPYKWHMDMNICASRPITRIVCLSHKVVTEMSDGNTKIRIRLVDQAVAPDTDVIILYRTAQFNEPSMIVQKSKEHEGYAALISFYPSFGESSVIEDGEIVDQDSEKFYKRAEETELAGSGEYIFLLDCSGSMGGERIAIAKSALKMFLQSLPIDSVFNIILFGSTYKSYKPKSVKYGAETLQEALKYLKQVDANMGGTEISSALNFLMGMPLSKGYPRSLFMLTDGAVSNPEGTIEIVKKNAHNTRVHTFGIGAGASRYLVKGCAIAGNGDFQFATEDEDITPKVVAALSKACLPAYVGEAVEWPKDVKVSLQSPPEGKLGNVYMNEPFVLLAILDSLPEASKGKKLVLKLQETQEHKELKLEAIIPEKVIEGEDIYQIAVKHAFERHKDLTKKDKEKLSIKYSVLSDETAFIAIQKNQGVTGGPIKTVKIPIAITKDASNTALSFPSRAARNMPMPMPMMPTMGIGSIGYCSMSMSKPKSKPKPMSVLESEPEPVSQLEMPLIDCEKEEFYEGSLALKEIAVPSTMPTLSMPKSAVQMKMKKSSKPILSKLHQRLADMQNFIGKWNLGDSLFDALNLSKEK